MQSILFSVMSKISGGTGEKPEPVLVISTPKDLMGLVKPAGPNKPLPPHIDPNRSEWIGKEIGKVIWGRADRLDNHNLRY